jgi:hypothetical protein
VVLLVVVYSIHMLISSWLSLEPLIAGLAFELRLPVPRVIHVLISSWLSPEPLIAGLAFELRLPVVKCIHVLNSSQLVNKLAIACLALIVVVHLELVCERWPIKFRSNNKW